MTAAKLCKSANVLVVSSTGNARSISATIARPKEDLVSGICVDGQTNKTVQRD